MRYLFIVQGEGRGHLTQAMTLEKMLLRHGHEVVEILVGKSDLRAIPEFFEKSIESPVKYFSSFNFMPSVKNKRPNVFLTVCYNLNHIAHFYPSVKFIKDEINRLKPDVVINFYELLGAAGFRLSSTKAKEVCIGHQYLLYHKDFHLPIVGYEGHIALDLFSKMTSKTASKCLALSFRKMEDDPQRKLKVVPPLLRPEVLNMRKDDGTSSIEEGDYILGYMLNAGFAQDVMRWHYNHPDVRLRFFWDRAEEGPLKKYDDTLSFYYLNDSEFLKQMAGCGAYASTAGFESICEAMYMGKPLMMVPSHIEQECNAFDATRYGAAVAAKDFDLSILLHFSKNGFKPDAAFPDWARSAEKIFLRELENPDF